MQENSSSFGFLSSTRARVLTALLIAQAAVFFLVVSRRENPPAARPLNSFPYELANWRLLREVVVDRDVQQVLKADDLLSRSYVDSTGQRAANLFVAYFKSQRTGQAPHSPKNCLPGAGWVESEASRVTLKVPGRAEPIRVNYYVVSKGEDKSIVLYWYQSRDRVIASEYNAKLYLIEDAIRYNRTDTALVRVVVPVISNEIADATRTAEQFVQDVFPLLKGFLPS